MLPSPVMDRFPSLQKKLSAIYGLKRSSKKKDLRGMQALMLALGNPQHNYPSIHITGTNGKGSTASFIATILRQAGAKVGLFTSPHLCRFNERIRVNGRSISDRKLNALIDELHAAVTKEKLKLTFFEFITALGLLHFAQERIDMAVIEVGIGGTLDATNVIQPAVSVITNIGLDHAEYLGYTKPDVARHKAGIIKLGVPLVTAEIDPALQKYFSRVCRQQKSPMYAVDDYYPVTRVTSTFKGQKFVIKSKIDSLFKKPTTFSISLLGLHQVRNAITALTTIDVLVARGMRISQRAIKRGLAQTRWPGRLQIVSRQPFILLDGAHNNDGAKALAQFLEHQALPPKEVLLLAMKKGKNLGQMIEKIVPQFRHIIVSQGNFEPTPAAVLAKKIRKVHSSVQALPDLEEAFATGVAFIGNGLMLVTGSMYLVGDTLALLAKQKTSHYIDN